METENKSSIDPFHGPTNNVILDEHGAMSDQNQTAVSDGYTTVLSAIVPSLKWCPTSAAELERVETKLLSVLTRPFKGYFVDVGPAWDLDSNKIRTIEMLPDDVEGNTQTKENEKAPLLLLHGFGSGVGSWILNLDVLSSTIPRRIYAIDLIGFARSSRPTFDLSGDVEHQFVDSIEKWRQAKGIERLIILGHSFGGYLAGCYALTHPSRVAHLILADPWGVQDRQISHQIYRLPIWVRGVNFVFQNFAPLAILRATGPYGPRLVHKFRSDLREKFRPKLNGECSYYLDYIYHCNAQNPTGERAFKSLTLPYGWPKYPLIHRLIDLDPSVPMTIIYGARSWIEKSPGEFLKDCMPGRVTVNVIQGAGHHVYADKYTEFNDSVKEACSRIEQ